MKVLLKAMLLLALCLIVPLSASGEGMVPLTFDGFTCYLWDSWHYLETKDFNGSAQVTYTKAPGSRLGDIFVIQTKVAASPEALYDHGKVTERLARSTAEYLCARVYSVEMFELNGVPSALIIGSYPTGAHDYHVICMTRQGNVGVVLRLAVSTDTMEEARAMMMLVLGEGQN